MSSLPEPFPVTELANAAAVRPRAAPSPARRPRTAPSSAGATTTTASSATGATSSRRGRWRSRASADRIAAGGAHTCAVSRDSADAPDAFVCWGADQAGQLGDNDDVDRGSPAASRGRWHLRRSRRARSTPARSTRRRHCWCWGRGSRGQLGPGHAIDTPLPVEVALPAGDDKAIAAAAGDGHTCVLVSPDGAAGASPLLRRQRHGQLGDGTFISRAAPAPVALGTTGVRATPSPRAAITPARST